MWAIIGSILELLVMLLGKWFEVDKEKKEQIKEILKEKVPNAKDVNSIVAMFNSINRI